VLAAAVVGDDSRLDEVGIYLRTASSLEAHDIRVLADLPRPRPRNFASVPIVGAVHEEELAEALPPDQRALLTPIVSRLSREGLIADVAIGTWDYKAAWRLTPYGHKFLRFLPRTSRATYNAQRLWSFGRRIVTNDLSSATLVPGGHQYTVLRFP
jgi:hypothetical protein